MTSVKELLDSLKDYPPVSYIKVGDVEVSFDRGHNYPPAVDLDPEVIAKALSSTPSMPPDEQMLFASTETFDEMMAKDAQE